MKPPAPLPRSGSKKGRAAAFCNLPLLLLIGAIQFLVIYSPAIDRYMVMVTKGIAIWAISFDRSYHALRFLNPSEVSIRRIH